MNKHIILVLTPVLFLAGCASPSSNEHATKKLPVGKDYSIVKFDKDSSVIKSTESELINNAKNILAHYPDSTIHLKGRSSEDGDSDYNLGLSNKRVEKVMLKIVEEGIPSGKVKSEHVGESDPLMNPAIEDKHANRSVEINIIN